MRNIVIREAIAEAGIKYWEVAEQLGIADFTLSRMLRGELVGDRRDKVLAAIEKAREAKQKEAG